MRTADDPSDVDVAIVGGGLVGASLAVALRAGRLRVALIESAAPPAASPSWDERCIAINHASELILRELGVWERLAPQAEPILSTHISERGRFGVARFSAGDAGIAALGYNVPLRALGQVLWHAVQETSTSVLCPAKLRALSVGADRVELHVEGPAGAQTLSARLAIAADGAASPVRALLGIGAERRDYGQSAIVTAVRTSRPHRGCAYERFTPDGPIALLPKTVVGPVEGPGQACSLVWTVPSGQVQDLLALAEAEFLARAQALFGERLGTFTALGCRVAHPLERVMSEELGAARVLFVGNAAQALHPVAAQGFNLGLRDAATAAAMLVAEDGDPGAPARLRAYAQRRSGDRESVSRFTDRLVRTFSNRVPGLQSLRHLGLLALDLTPPLKDAVMWQNLGFGAGGVPRQGP